MVPAALLITTLVVTAAAIAIAIAPEFPSPFLRTKAFTVAL
jgi:hypothetical protein